jgi:hypothetical protein
MDNIINDLYKDILKSLTPKSRSRFNELFSQVFALNTPSDILKGLTIAQKLGNLKRTIELLDEEGNQNSSSYSPVGSPIVTAMFKAIQATYKLKPVLSESGLSTPKHKDPNLKVKSQSQPKKAVPISKAPSLPESKEPKAPTKVRKPSKAKLTKIYDEIRERHADSTRHVFSEMSYVTCENKNCKFCRSMLVNFSLTKCLGHSRCIKSGWYIHFSQAFWQKFRKIHDSGKPYITKEHELKRHELLSYNAHLSRANSQALCQMELDPSTIPLPPSDSGMGDEYDSDNSSITVVSSTSSKSSKKMKIGEVYKPGESWADIVERKFIRVDEPSPRGGNSE